ncbi:hypothetical protein KFE98_03605 [bacterium SCSIO 12741]|nr:hypothetical protein KFE98_03605 [bacterium SCSIO 12741]
MDIVLEILKLTIPGMIVFLTTFYMLKQVLESQYKRKELELRREARQAFTPTKVNAYERLTLFLERIHPSELVLRTHKKGMKGRHFQSELVKSIRTEYQHNLTQQLYVSPEAWGLIKIAKEETIKLINIAASNMPENASGIDLSNMIFQIMMKMKENPVDVAKDYLRRELRKSL